MALFRRTSAGRRGAKFTAKRTPPVRVARDGGHNLGTPTHCAAKRGHANTRGGRY